VRLLGSLKSLYHFIEVLKVALFLLLLALLLKELGSYPLLDSEGGGAIQLLDDLLDLALVL